MRSKVKPVRAKRAALPRRSDYTRQFAKDWESLAHSGQHDMGRLKEVMNLLIANDGPLPPEWMDHELQGEWMDHRECHVKGDLLLIYKLDGDMVKFTRTGTHSKLFGR